MSLNLFIFGFSVIIFILGGIMVYLSSKEFQRMADEEEPQRSEFAGRAAIANRFIQVFSNPEDLEAVRKKEAIERILEGRENT